jgi:hypothetical protein
VLWNEGLYTATEGMANRLGLMIKIKKKETCTDRDGNTGGQE